MAKIEPHAQGYFTRLRYRGGRRGRFVLPFTDERAAQRRADALEAMIEVLGIAASSEPAKPLLREAAGCDDERFKVLERTARALGSGQHKPKSSAKGSTVKDVGKLWTDGDLARDYPDHVKAKDHYGDKTRLAFLCALDVGNGLKLGDVPIAAFTVEHAETAMRKLPKEAKRPATRRHYAQVIHRVLALAVYPLRLIPANPLPRGFMPKAGKPPAHAYLYPDEDAKLLTCTAVPIPDRLLFGFLAREGLRLGEALDLRWRDLDLQRGALKLDDNKTDDSRAWALDPGVARALGAWKARLGEDVAGDDFLFAEENGNPFEPTKLSDRLRAALGKAQVTRPELTEKSTTRSPIRVHDLRGTFVTLSLANGKTETWVADRTGHRSSQMINRYRRAARSASELGLGELAALDQAIPEFRAVAAPAKPAVGVGGRRGGPQGWATAD